jgi:effector-binding domain-containing protein
MDTLDIVIKRTHPLRIAEASDTAPGFGPLLASVFGRLYPRVLSHLSHTHAHPGLCVAYYDEPADDGSVVVHAGFAIGDQQISANKEIGIVDLPVIDVASVVHHGSMDNVEAVYEALVRWIDDSGYQLAGRSRELYLEWHDDNLAANLTELQIPIAT